MVTCSIVRPKDETFASAGLGLTLFPPSLVVQPVTFEEADLQRLFMNLSTLFWDLISIFRYSKEVCDYMLYIFLYREVVKE